MVSSTSRWKVLALLACLLAAQFHFLAEANGFQNPSHQCQLCKTGGWAEPVQDLRLDAQLATNPLQEMPSADGEHYFPIETSSSRAPPLC